MAKAAEEGAKKVAGNEVILRRIPETLPPDILEKTGATEAQKAFSDVLPLTHDDLVSADAVLFGVPTRFGGIPAQVQQFIDTTGPLWQQGALIGKIGGVFVSTASQHGGQETTIRHMHTMMLHHGFVIAGLPYAFQKQLDIAAVSGGSPYGASTLTGGDGSRMPSADELEGVSFQAEHLARLAAKLCA